MGAEFVASWRRCLGRVSERVLWRWRQVEERFVKSSMLWRWAGRRRRSSEGRESRVRGAMVGDEGGEVMGDLAGGAELGLRIEGMWKRKLQLLHCYTI